MSSTSGNPMEIDDDDNLPSSYDEIYKEEKQILGNEELGNVIDESSKKLQQQQEERNREMDDIGKEFQNSIQEKEDEMKNLREQWEKDKKEWSKGLNSERARSHEQEERKDNEIKKLQVEVKRLQEEIKASRGNVYLHEINKLKDICEKKDDEIRIFKEEKECLNEHIRKLKEKNKSLDEENGKLQNYIGEETTFFLNDADENHSVSFVKDVENLQKLIEDYVGNLRRNVEINLEEVNELLRQYGCQQVKSPKDDNNELRLVKAVLQRHIFVEVINYIKHNLEQYLEGEIYGITNNLLAKLDELSKTRDGANEITKALPIKIRQKIYGCLGNVGFADVIKDENQQEQHPFISEAKNWLNKLINKFRVINDSQKKKLHNDMATSLIQKFTRIYAFRRKVQEPIPQFISFVCDTKVNTELMEGPWKVDEDIDEDNLLVEICSFPTLVANYEKKNQKLYTPAKVVHQFKSKP